MGSGHAKRFDSQLQLRILRVRIINSAHSALSPEWINTLSYL
jgi:hypothetical protein